MKKFEVGQKVFYLGFNNIDGPMTIEETFEPSYLCVKRGIIKRVWNNGRIALENGKVIYDFYAHAKHNDVIGSLIAHVEMLDSRTKDICEHDFSIKDSSNFFDNCKLCGEEKSKV